MNNPEIMHNDVGFLRHLLDSENPKAQIKLKPTQPKGSAADAFCNCI